MANRNTSRGAYGADDEIVDYILGITFEIWEQRGIELIDQYYTADTLVYSLDGITHGSAEMIDGTRSMLATFPDRLLLGDDVITAGDCSAGYSSHRVLSPATNDGDSVFGAATGRPVRFMNMADCVIENGVITLEWLARDNLALVTQLGFEPVASARLLAARRSEELASWFESEADRISGLGIDVVAADYDEQDLQPFANCVLSANWVTGASDTIEAAYAPYAVAHRSPVETHSGRGAISAHYSMLRAAFDVSGVSVDHICVQKWGVSGQRVAIRWCAAASHRGEFHGIAATGKPVFIFGVTHWRIVDGRIAVEWTVFDTLSVMSQLV